MSLHRALPGEVGGPAHADRLRARGDRPLEALAIESTSRGSTSNAMPCANSSYGRPAGATTGVPQAIASSTGSPKPS